MSRYHEFLCIFLPACTIHTSSITALIPPPVFLNVLGFCPVALLKFRSTVVSGPCTPLTGPDDCLKSGYEGLRDNRDFGQAVLVAWALFCPARGARECYLYPSHPCEVPNLAISIRRMSLVTACVSCLWRLKSSSDSGIRVLWPGLWGWWVFYMCSKTVWSGRRNICISSSYFGECMFVM